MFTSPVDEGELVVGKYQVGGVLGQGGMGIVVRAMDVELQRPVAIKFLLAARLKDDEAFARFRREARATAQIVSEHAVRVYDSGRHKQGEPFIVMEWLDGSDLAARLKAEGAVPIEEAVELILQACEGLAAAHSVGIVHRDVKPGNLFLEERADGTRRLKVLDFGLAKPLDSGAMTASDRLLGSPFYMSPEQVRAPSQVDVRSDIWSLGVVLYELLTGERPFLGETALAVCAEIINTTPKAPSQTGAELPPGLDDIVLRCLTREKDERFLDVAELAEALVPFGSAMAQQSAARTRQTLLSSADVAKVSVATISSPESGSVRGWTSGATKSSRASVILSVSGVLLVAAAVALWLRAPGSSVPVEPASAASSSAAGQATGGVGKLADSAPSGVSSASVISPPRQAPAVALSATVPGVSTAPAIASTVPLAVAVPPVISAGVLHKPGTSATARPKREPTTSQRPAPRSTPRRFQQPAPLVEDLYDSRH